MQEIIDDIVESVSKIKSRGKVANYIPQLSGVDPGKFGIVVMTPNGEVFSGGDSEEEFSIQSISKIFILTIALGKLGDALWGRVGREPSGDPFNSIVQLEHENGRPRNPFINAGALSVVDAIMAGNEPKVTLAEILHFIRFLADDPGIYIDNKVAHSEKMKGDRNAALAHFMAAFGRIKHPVEQILGTYFHLCAIAMNCKQLAKAGMFLVSDGEDASREARIVSSKRARRINSLMLMCGHYDGSGDFAYRVGLPSKSGVGGGILAIAPGRAAIAVWSPGLDANGNSKLGSYALELLVQKTGWSVFGAPRPV